QEWQRRAIIAADALDAAAGFAESEELFVEDIEPEELSSEGPTAAPAATAEPTSRPATETERADGEG
ncbi:MAG TPA: hypothetical protein DCL57_06430, partial [Microbacterium sp.]|nr:hypothetical protein [Microbacterium sp.]